MLFSPGSDIQLCFVGANTGNVIMNYYTSPKRPNPTPPPTSPAHSSSLSFLLSSLASFVLLPLVGVSALMLSVGYNSLSTKALPVVPSHTCLTASSIPRPLEKWMAASQGSTTCSDRWYHTAAMGSTLLCSSSRPFSRWRPRRSCSQHPRIAFGCSIANPARQSPRRQCPG